ncbi:MAG: biopolymer transporter ExbD [Polyangiaceae bacterium]|nr:biopolymer transporter ExbD [Polyangiaceae bacterium]MBK8999349.1 biopolymer transporter ExbD [Myxococcales bacterium]MCE7893006.1 biopolymer transporter [Sorangiineae bacterium PRO1]MCL4752918.1 biopolymer transporter ExbD [Myxococcales bacterium]
MAQIDTGSHASSRRETNRELPLVPFIDFLLCLVSFLLITAVWSQMARVEASANVPGKQCEDGPCKDEKPKRLHVDMKEKKFSLAWKQGDTVVATAEVERKPVKTEAGDVRFPELEKRLAEEWRTQGVHKAATDDKTDQAVLHTLNDTEFGELVAVMDALHAQRKERKLGGATAQVPAFAVTFAAN